MPAHSSVRSTVASPPPTPETLPSTSSRSIVNAPAACWKAWAAVLIPSGVARSAARPSWDQLAPRLKTTAAFSKCTFAMDTLLFVLKASAQENATSM